MKHQAEHLFAILVITYPSGNPLYGLFYFRSLNKLVFSVLSTFPVPTGISKSCSDVHVLTMYTYNIECVETRSHRCYEYDNQF